MTLEITYVRVTREEARRTIKISQELPYQEEIREEIIAAMPTEFENPCVSVEFHYRGRGMNDMLTTVVEELNETEMKTRLVEE